MRRFFFFFILSYIGFAAHSSSGEFPIEEALVPKCEVSSTAIFQEETLVENSVALFLPAALFQYQNKAQSLWYSHIQGQFESVKKIGFISMGIGVRAIVSDDWFVGVYCLASHQKDFNSNQNFQNLNLGVEWISIPYQLSFNSYLPLDKTYLSSASGVDLIGSWQLAPAWKLSAGIYTYPQVKGMMAGVSYDINTYFKISLKGVYSEGKSYALIKFNLNLGDFERSRESVIEEALRVIPAVWYSVIR